MRLLSGFSSLDARDRRALTIGVGVVAPLLIAALVIRPYVGALLEDHQALASERALLAREYRAALDLPGDRRALAALDSVLLQLAPRLFAGSDVVTESAELARYAAQQATAARLDLAQVETQTRIDSAPARLSEADLRISLRARGDILAIHTFLHAIEDGSKLVRVERIEIVRGSEGDDGGSALTFTAVLASRAGSSAVPMRAGVAGAAP